MPRLYQLKKMKIKHHVELQPYNSFRTKAIAKLFGEPKTVEELSEILKKYPDEQKLILGNGFNLFFTHDFDGLVLKPNLRGIKILHETDEYVDIEAMAGEDWDAFVAFCVMNSYAGIENLSLIPGSVGAAPIQNIGAYGTELEDVCVCVKAMDLSTLQEKTFINAACEFSYRNSLFKRTRQFVVISVVFRLQKSFLYKEKYIDLNNELKAITHPTLQQMRDAVIRVRTRKLPDHIALPNAGSFFKNPIISRSEKDRLLSVLPDVPVYSIDNEQFKTSAAYLIDHAGWKGKRIGHVGTHENHALIIVNYGTENGHDIVHFMQRIRHDVFEKFGIALEPEVWIF